MSLQRFSIPHRLLLGNSLFKLLEECENIVFSLACTYISFTFPLVIKVKFIVQLYSSTRNDLWALGCTVFQMLSGTSPFKDASEWLIFQRIIARDIKFPDYLSDEARDLIDRLLVSFSFL